MIPQNFFLHTLKTVCLLVICTTFSVLTYAQTRSFTGTYTENFDTLANSGTNTWTDDSTIDGWQSSQTTYVGNNGSSNNGNLYSYGNTASADRALGSLASSGTGTVTFGVCFTNNTGVTIQQINVGYTGEQWRVGSTPALGDTIAFSYQTGVNSVVAGGTWTSVSALNFASPTTSPNNSAVDGNVAPNRIVISPILISGLSIANGTDFCLRWQDLDNTGADYGASVDDLTVSLAPTAAGSSLRGRLVTSTGRGVSNSQVVLTNAATGEVRYARSSSFGYFRFEDLPTGDLYILDVPSKRFLFNQTSFTLNGDLTDLVLTAQ
jgi:hypothetical protein